MFTTLEKILKNLKFVFYFLNDIINYYIRQPQKYVKTVW